MQVEMDFGWLLDRFLADFGTKLGAKLEPSWRWLMQQQCIPEGWQQGLAYFLPKETTPANITKFRTILLENGVYKLYGSVLEVVCWICKPFSTVVGFKDRAIHLLQSVLDHPDIDINAVDDALDILTPIKFTYHNGKIKIRKVRKYITNKIFK